jgi:dCMP deaminase
MNDKWTTRFMELAALVSTWSKDTPGVGCVIVDGDTRVVLGLGFNGFPRGVLDSEERLADDELKNKLVVHAEANAILNATRSVEGAILYCTRHPCSQCAKLIVQSGVRYVVCPPPPTRGKWGEDAPFAELILREGMVDV